MRKPFYHVSQAESQRSIAVVQAEDMSEAYKRASLVLPSLALPFDPLAENWVIREAQAPYHCAVFAEGYFQLYENSNTQLH